MFYRDLLIIEPFETVLFHSYLTHVFVLDYCGRA